MKNLPIGQQSFVTMRSADFLYIDKTEYVHRLITGGSWYCFLSRPRRFGKSLLLSTIQAAFEGKKELFKGLYIYDKINWEEKYPVLTLDMAQLATKSIDTLIPSIADELRAIGLKYEIDLPQENPVDIFRNLIRDVREKTGKPVVLLIDEYDKPILDAMDNLEKASQIRSFLQNFYTVIKSSSAHLRFVLLTGVSKISQTSVFSGLNNLNDISMDREYTGICGYTQEELETGFKEYIPLLSKEMEMLDTETLAEIKRWYNGYSWDGKTFVYNPFSVLLLFQKKEFDYHWFTTGTPTFLIKLLQQKDDLSVLLQEEIMVPRGFADTQSLEQLNIIPLFFQTGYLTIKKSVPKERLYCLQIPNEEVRSALTEAILTDYTAQDKFKVSELALNMKKAFTKGDTAFALENLKTLFSQVSNNTHIASESHYHALFQLTMNLVSVDHLAEHTHGKGRTDSVLKFPERVYVIEMKCSKNNAKLPDAVTEAMQQIKRQKYYQPFLHQGKKVHLLALAFGKGEMEYAEEIM